MILTGKEIEKNLNDGIVIEPFDKKQLNPNSYNVKLHNELFVYKDPVLDMKKKNEVERIIIPEEGFILEPGQLYLGRTVEYTETSKFVPMLEGRSSIGRIGIFIHVTAGIGDVSFFGHWTLEISCIQPVKIYPFVEVGQLIYYDIRGDITEYQGKYQKNKGVQASMLYKDFE